MLCSFSVAGLKQADAVPGRFEEPFTGWPEGLPTIGGAALHLGGLALCGSGSASITNVRLSCTPVKKLFVIFPAHCAKSDFGGLWMRLYESRDAARDSRGQGSRPPES